MKKAGPKEPGPSWFRVEALLVLDLVVHQAVLDLVQSVHRLHHRRRLGLRQYGDLRRLLDDLVDRDREHGRHLPLIGQIQHLELIQELVDVMHLVPARVLGTLDPALARSHVLDGAAGLLDHGHIPYLLDYSLKTTCLLSRTTCKKSI